MTKKANQVNATKVFEAVQAAINTRIEKAENENQAKNIKAELKLFSLPVVEYAVSQGFDVDALAKTIAVTDKKNGDFLAVYALQKVRKVLTALAQGLKSPLDPYTRTIAINLAHDAQNNKSALVSLSKAIVFDEFDNQKKITARYGCSAGTAGTQMSSTRQALRVLGIATVTKGKAQDEFMLTASPFAMRMVDILTAK